MAQVFCLKWKCPECNRTMVMVSQKKKLKRELQQELEDGTKGTCSNCETEVDLDENNTVIDKVEM